MLILFIIRKIKKSSFFAKNAIVVKRIAYKIGLLVMLLIFSSGHAFNGPNSKSISFKIIKGDKKIGQIDLGKLTIENTVEFNLKSDISARLIFNFRVIGLEKSIYENGKLIYSSVYRKFNNKIKSDHRLTFRDGQYILKNTDKQEYLEIKKIENNLITLYFNEPLNISEVYCDNANKMVPVESLGNHRYKVQISSSKYNIFYYENGHCVKVEAAGSMFKVDLILI